MALARAEEDGGHSRCRRPVGGARSRCQGSLCRGPGWLPCKLRSRGAAICSLGLTGRPLLPDICPRPRPLGLSAKLQLLAAAEVIELPARLRLLLLQGAGPPPAISFQARSFPRQRLSCLISDPPPPPSGHPCWLDPQKTNASRAAVQVLGSPASTASSWFPQILQLRLLCSPGEEPPTASPPCGCF